MRGCSSKHRTIPILRKATSGGSLKSVAYEFLDLGYICVQEQKAAGSRDEQIALRKPFHIALIHLLRRDEPVLLPGVVAHQVSRQDFMPLTFKEFHDSSCDVERGSITSDGEAEVDFHT